MSIISHIHTHDIKSQVIKKSSEIISTQVVYSEGGNSENQPREWDGICELCIWQRVSVQNTQGVPIAVQQDTQSPDMEKAAKAPADIPVKRLTGGQQAH